jgi:hypothetical protein
MAASRGNPFAVGCRSLPLPRLRRGSLREERKGMVSYQNDELSIFKKAKRTPG